ncbi:MAG: TrmB family transcriptional regulator [Candidatus Thalassarchaeaceae archaeon]
MNWNTLLIDAGLSEREAEAVIALSANPNLKASELAKELGTTRLDAYNSLERLQSGGLVTVTADRPMKFSSPPLKNVLEHLINIRKEQLKKIEQGYEDIKEGKTQTIQEDVSLDLETEPKFAVLKERVHIFSKIEKMALESKNSLILTLGKFGILHLCRSTALSEVNKAAKRGVEVKVMAQLDRRTIRFFSELDPTVEIRHSDDLESQGTVMDQLEAIQYLNTEENPVGRGKTDAALLIQSMPFAESQRNLIESIWEDAIPFELASKRFTEERIVDPLKLTLDGGSFLDRIRDVLQISEELPESDTPFNLDAFMASGLEISDARKKLGTGGISSLSTFGIDIGSLLRQVGNRIGEELAFSLRKIDGHVEFLSEMMDWYEYAGLGELSYDADPIFHIKVHLLPDADNSDQLPLWELDDGIIEGTLLSRYSSMKEVIIERIQSVDNKDEFCRYNLVLSDDN